MKTLGDLGEFDLIARIRTRAGRSRDAHVVVGIGDDAAVLRPRRGEDLVVTTDTLVEGVHFRFGNQAAATIGRRALRVNLSDLAAMGARPLGFTLALSAPASLELAVIDGVMQGMLEDAKRYGCPLVGGNIARAGEVQLAVTAFGAVEKGCALLRDAAKPGDRVCVTGTLGGAGLALARSERKGGRMRRLPEPRLAAGRALAARPDVGACIDLSDGFASDLRHVLAASGVGAEIDAGALPLPRGFAAACRTERLDPLALATRAGEDYELLFTLRGAARGSPTTKQLERALGIPVSQVGRITRRRGVRGLPEGPGFRHF